MRMGCGGICGIVENFGDNYLKAVDNPVDNFGEARTAV
jgi:hypothetical protein